MILFISKWISLLDIFMQMAVCILCFLFTSQNGQEAGVIGHFCTHVYKRNASQPLYIVLLPPQLTSDTLILSLPH